MGSRWHQNWYRSARQGNEYKSSIPTLGDGDPRADPQLPEILRNPVVAMEETCQKEDSLPSRSFFPGPKVLGRQGLSTQISSATLPG